MRHPRSGEDWLRYVDELPVERLYEQARAANSLAFVSTLRDEGLEPRAITAILERFGRRLLEEGLPFPGGGYLDYALLLERDRWLGALEGDQAGRLLPGGG